MRQGAASMRLRQSWALACRDAYFVSTRTLSLTETRMRAGAAQATALTERCLCLSPRGGGWVPPDWSSSSRTPPAPPPTTASASWGVRTLGAFVKPQASREHCETALAVQRGELQHLEAGVWLSAP